MLTITKPGPNRVDIELSGRIDSEEMARGLDDLLEKSQDVNAGVMLYRITSFAFPDLGAIAVEMARLTAASLSLSRALVASSSNRTGASRTRARARATRWR